MSTRTRRWALFVGLAVVAALVLSTCGGGANASKDNQGAAASATADFFVQESAGGKLPETAAVMSIGTSSINALSVNSDQKKVSASLRYCVVYDYQDSVTPFKTHKRVYVTSKVKDGWSVEPVEQVTTCEGVS